MDVSVVIPAYRAATFIDRAIDSALAQQGVELEVVVVEDACPAATGDAVEARYGDDPRVRVLRLEQNQGPAGARNAGFRAARGMWIAILDADDAFEPGRLAHMVAVGQARAADVVADNVRYFDATTARASEPKIRSLAGPEQVSLHELVARGRPGTGELDYGLLKPMFRRAFVEGGPLYQTEVRHGEDFLFYVALVRRGAVFVVTPQAGYLWTLRSSGQSQTNENYTQQAEDTRRFKQDPEIAADPRLVDLFEARALALERLQRERNFDRDAEAGRVGPLLAAAARHPHLARRLLHRVRRKLRRG
jgi:succinoglycan biosynthesis protein ExoO